MFKQSNTIYHPVCFHMEADELSFNIRRAFDIWKVLWTYEEIIMY
jgi:hypothetical protein